MSLRIGVMPDSFDPVRSSHLEACKALLSSGKADQVLLVPAGDDSSCTASQRDRWQMLNAACAGSRSLFPCLLSEKRRSSGPDHILKFLQKKHPDDRLFLLRPPAVSADSPAVGPESLPPAVLEYCSVKGLYGIPSRLFSAGEWIDRLFDSLNPHRFAHSLSVALTSLSLAARFGIDPVRAEQAGLLHDCAKCLPLPEMQRLARKHRLTDDPAFLASGALLHSLVGAWMAREKYGMDDPEVLEAISFHNTGHAGMSRLAMCVCLADFIEPNRDPFPLLEEVRRLAGVSLEKALLLSLEGVSAHVLSRGKALHPRTAETIEWLRSLPSVQSDADCSAIEST